MYHLGAIEPAPSCAPEPSRRGDGWQGPAEAATAWALPPLLPSAPPPTGAAAQAPGTPGVEATAPGRRLGLSLIPSALVSLRALRGPLRLPPMSGLQDEATRGFASRHGVRLRAPEWCQLGRGGQTSHTPARPGPLSSPTSPPALLLPRSALPAAALGRERVCRASGEGFTEIKVEPELN